MTGVLVVMECVPVWANDKDITIHRQIFAIATSDVQTNGARFETFEEALDDWPRLLQKHRNYQHDFRFFPSLLDSRQRPTNHTLYLVSEKCDAICS